MKTYVPIIVIALLIIAAGASFYAFNDTSNAVHALTDYKNTAYTIEGQTVPLIQGRAEAPIAGSASKTITQYFGNEATGDLNGDGAADVAFILTQSTGGSGTFYYVVAALKTADGYQGTNAIMLGDRIAPQTTEIHDGQVLVNFVDRKSNEPMTVEPSVGVSKYVQVDGTTLVETTPTGE